MSLNSLFGMGRGIDVYVSVSPACGLEMIELDNHGNVKSYAQTQLDYNEAQREIASYDDFKTGLETLFQMRNINPAKANVHLSLPTVWFGSKEGLPLLLDDSAITNIVIGELEQSYIFKRKEPLPFWFDALASSNSDSRNVFYTAVQAEVVNQIKDILTAMGATLVSVGASLFADLKALYSTGIGAEQMQGDQSWSLMIINNSGFQLLGLQGKRILEYYEEPLPLKSYEGEEVYAAIENAAQIALMSTPSSSLIVVSETNAVSAEIIAGRLQFGGTTIFVEDNEYRKEPLTELGLNVLAEDQEKVSLHSIGNITPAGILPVDANFIAEKGKGAAQTAVIEIPMGGSVFELTPIKASIIMLIIIAVFMAPLGLVYFLSSNTLAGAQTQSSELDNQITQLDQELKTLQSQEGKVEFDPVAEIEKVLKLNKAKIMTYAALGESIPENLYLTYFITADDGLINIKGCADSVEDVYVFYKNLKESLVDSKLRLSKLDLKAGLLDSVVSGKASKEKDKDKNLDVDTVLVTNTISPLDNAPYIFEITNMSDSQLKSFMNKFVVSKDNKAKQSNSTEQQPAQ